MKRYLRNIYEDIKWDYQNNWSLTPEEMKFRRSREGLRQMHKGLTETIIVFATLISLILAIQYWKMILVVTIMVYQLISPAILPVLAIWLLWPFIGKFFDIRAKLINEQKGTHANKEKVL